MSSLTLLEPLGSVASSTSTVDNISPAFMEQRQLMQLCHDLMGGTATMREAGTRYIQREAGEDVISWENRVNRTFLYNVFGRTLRYLSGRVFQKPVVLGDDATDPRFEAFIENVDKQGHNLTSWSRRAFEAGLRDGVVFAVADFAAVATRRGPSGQTQYQRRDGTWADKTEAADRANGWSPYLIRVDAGQVLDCRVEWEGGRPRVTHFRYMETLEEADGPWATRQYQQIRAYYYDEAGRAVWEVYRNESSHMVTRIHGSTGSRAGSGVFVLLQSGTFSINVLPVCVYMAGERRTASTAVPALMDLAWLNCRHWQATSDQNDLMTYVRRPVWFGCGLGIHDPETNRKKITFGPGILCVADETSARLESVGIEPGAVEAGRQELNDLESRMALYGLQLLQPKTGVITATESARDAEESNSTLKSWALEFQDFLENCMVYVALWWGMQDGPSVKVNTDFASNFDVSVLMELNRLGVLSGESLLNLVKNMGILPDDFDVEGEAGRIATGVMTNASAGGAGRLERFIQNAGQL